MNIVDALLSNGDQLDAVIAQSWKAPGSILASALGIGGQRRIVGGNDKLDVTTEGRVWLVLSGHVDVFLVDEIGRYPFLFVEAGGLIDGLPTANTAVRFVGVPSADTEVVETTRTALQQLAARSEVRPALKQAWRDWFELLSHWHRADATPRDAEGADPGHDLAAAAVKAVLFRRQNELVRSSAERESGHRLSEADFGSGLHSLVDLLSVKSRIEQSIEAETVGTAAARVARALGLPELVRRREQARSLRLSDAIEQISWDNHLQYRMVELEGDWWKSNAGPLIATIGPQSAPCALIPEGNRYLLHADGIARVVNAETAAAIGRTAYSFYVPFPQGPLTSWRILRFGLHNSRADVVTISFTLLLTGLFSLATPIAMGWLLDPIVPDAELGQIGVIASLLLLLSIGMTATYLVESLGILRLEARADNRVQAAVWIRLLNLRTPFFRNFTAGDLANRAEGINAIRKLSSQSLMTFASGGVSIVFSLGLLIYYEWRITLFVALVSALFGIVAYLIGKRVLNYNFETLDLSGRLQGTVLQLLNSIAKLRIAGAERESFLRWLHTYRRTVELSLRQRILGNRLYVLRSGFGPMVTIVMLIVLGAHSGDLLAFFRSSRTEPYTPLMTTAEFASFNVALGQFVAAVMSLTRASLFLVMLQPYSRRVGPILDAEEELTGQGGRIAPLNGEIELRDVRFRYAPDAPLALKGLSMRIPAGSFVAVVGPSGAGKSSIVRLLLGFEVPESGDIYVDGTDIRLLDVQDLRRQYGVVLQNGRMLAGSIYDNISAGLPLSREEAVEALRIAALDDVVASLPMGVHTSIAEGGVTFSGGQRQRLLIARAVVRRPRVLIVDEATSALDNITQRRVMENLRSLKCTQVVIAQRLSTVESADLIYVVDDGRVVESGNYLQLLEKGALFKKLAERQLL
jgi:NHLM bacteriocin system ABC transporter ATP-binding protein